MVQKTFYVLTQDCVLKALGQLLMYILKNFGKQEIGLYLEIWIRVKCYCLRLRVTVYCWCVGLQFRVTKKLIATLIPCSAKQLTYKKCQIFCRGQQFHFI